MITGKDKHCRERTVYSLKEIRNKFLEDASEIVGKKILFSEWNPTESIEDAKTTKPELAASTGAAPVAEIGVSIGVEPVQVPVEPIEFAGFPFESRNLTVRVAISP